VVKVLLDKGVDLNVVSENGLMAVLLAAERKEMETHSKEMSLWFPASGTRESQKVSQERNKLEWKHRLK
jgi:hypothetical protein